MKPAIEKINDYIKARDLQANAVKASNAISAFLEKSIEVLELDELKQLTATRDLLSKYIWGTQVNEKWVEFTKSLDTQP